MSAEDVTIPLAFCVAVIALAVVTDRGCAQCEQTNRAKIQAQNQALEKGFKTTTITVTTNTQPISY